MACKRAPVREPPPPPEVPDLGTVVSAPVLLEMARHNFPWLGCMDVAADIAAEAGPRSMSCTNDDAVTCIDQALRRREPFIFLHSGFGGDSFISKAVVGTPGGAVVFYYADSMGPAFKGTCLRQNVLSGVQRWPVCTRELSDRIDLRTCGPYQEPYSPRYAEPWPPGCDAHAPADLPTGVQVFHRVSLITDPKKWSLRCDQLSVHALVIVDENGNVACVRVLSFLSLSAGEAPPPPGLYDEIRKNAMQWKFSRPVIYGHPVRVQRAIYEDRCGIVN
jgi:hypothetical protein